jgi:hypothetical protein
MKKIMNANKVAEASPAHRKPTISKSQQFQKKDTLCAFSATFLASKALRAQNFTFPFPFESFLQ